MDFWRLYNAHKKRERQRIRSLSIQLISNRHFENPEEAPTAEIETYKDLWHILTETPRPEVIHKNPMEQMTEEERQELQEADLAIIREMERQKELMHG